jgi:acetyl esterase/lipase
MTYALDAELLREITAKFAAGAMTLPPPAERDDWKALRANGEAIEYARRAAAAGTSVELHVHPGCPHGFDRAVPGADVVRRSHADRLRALRGC